MKHKKKLNEMELKLVRDMFIYSFTNKFINMLDANGSKNRRKSNGKKKNK